MSPANKLSERGLPRGRVSPACLGYDLWPNSHRAPSSQTRRFQMSNVKNTYENVTKSFCVSRDSQWFFYMKMQRPCAPGGLKLPLSSGSSGLFSSPLYLSLVSKTLLKAGRKSSIFDSENVRPSKRNAHFAK